MIDSTPSSSATPGRTEVFHALRALVREVMPDTVEQLDLPDRVLAFGFGRPARALRGLAVGLHPARGARQRQLADGALLPDAAGLVEGNGSGYATSSAARSRT